MSQDSNDDPDREDDPIFQTATSLIGSVADDETAERFAEQADDLLGENSATEAVLGGLAAGEQINQVREQSREMATTARNRNEPQTSIEARTVEGEGGEFAGTRIFVDNPQARWFEGDGQVLIKSEGEEFEVSVPQGIGEIEAENNQTILELLVRPEGYDDTPDLVAPAEADDHTECQLCFDLDTDPKAPNRCTEHREHPNSEPDPEGTDGENGDIDSDGGESDDDE